MLGISGENYVGSEEPLRSSRYLTSGFKGSIFAQASLCKLGQKSKPCLPRVLPGRDKLVGPLLLFPFAKKVLCTFAGGFDLCEQSHPSFFSVPTTKVFFCA